MMISVHLGTTLLRNLLKRFRGLSQWHSATVKRAQCNDSAIDLYYDTVSSYRVII